MSIKDREIYKKVRSRTAKIQVGIGSRSRRHNFQTRAMFDKQEQRHNVRHVEHIVELFDLVGCLEFQSNKQSGRVRFHSMSIGVHKRLGHDDVTKQRLI